MQVAALFQSLQPIVPPCIEMCMSFTHDTSKTPTQPIIILSATALIDPDGPERDSQLKSVEAVYQQVSGSHVIRYTSTMMNEDQETMLLQFLHGHCSQQLEHDFGAWCCSRLS